MEDIVQIVNLKNNVNKDQKSYCIRHACFEDHMKTPWKQ